jgi:FKBP-type peptidyl-prolyl cis-trans isomerase SlyD
VPFHENTTQFIENVSPLYEGHLESENYTLTEISLFLKRLGTMNIAKDKVVTLDYNMYDDEDGALLESSQEDGPLVYIHGYSEIPEGLENALTGKKTGDSVKITLEPEDAYGEYDDSLLEAVERSSFDNIDELEIGMRLSAETDEGFVAFHVIGFEGDDVILDGNETYAGYTVRFEVNVLSVRDATPDEIEHGHVHSDDCDHDHDDE